MPSKIRSRLFVYRYQAITLGFLLITAILLVALVQLRQQDFIDNQQALVDAMTRATASEIGLLVGNHRRSVELFAEDNLDQLAQIARFPDDEERVDALKAKVSHHFSNSFGMTLAKASGEVLLDDFDGLVGEICERDLRHFAITRRPYEIFVHPHASVYHFDMPVSVSGIGSEPVIFFISFQLIEIARLLANGAPPGHRFMLVKADDPALIEVTHRGSRAILAEDIRLDEESLKSVALQTKVANTNWLLVDIPEPNLFSTHKNGLYAQALVIFLLVFSGSAVIYSLLNVESTRRRLTQSRLIETNRRLSSTSSRLLESEKMASLGGLLAKMLEEVVEPLKSTRSMLARMSTRSNELQSDFTLGRVPQEELETHLEQVARVSKEAELNLEAMAALLDDVEALASLQNQLEVKPFKLGEHIRKILESLQPGRGQGTINWSLGCSRDFEIYANPGALALVITHLALNSLHSRSARDGGSTIHLDIIKSGSDAIIRYQDSDAGVEAGSLDRMLELSLDQGRSTMGFSVFNALVRKLLHGRTEIDATRQAGTHISLFIPMDIRGPV